MIGAERAACASTGNTSGVACALLFGHEIDEGGYLYRVGKNQLRQIVPGGSTTVRSTVQIAGDS